MCAESHKVNSGFGRYTNEILKRLYNRPDYEIAEFACYEHDGNQRDVPWKVYPNAVGDNDQYASNYKSNPINQFGLWRFEKVLAHFKPDIVFDIRDYWMFSYQEMSPFRPYFHWVVAPTIDSIPQKQEWLTTFQNADVILTHTEWAANYLKSLNRSINIQNCVSDSVDPNVFRPVSWTKTYHKSKYRVPSDAFVIGSVMRNQKRKLIAELFSSLRELINRTKNNKIYLYLHTSYPEASGWDIPELLLEYGVYNNVLFTYYCANTKKVYVCPFQGPRIVAPDDPSNLAFFPNVIHGISNEQLSDIYNLFDIYVQYAICEGLGIPQLEAASCGIPIFAINYSGMEEITSKVNGVKLDHILVKELETGSDRAVPINEDFITKVIEWMKHDQKSRIKKSKETRSLLLENYSWDKTAENLMEVFDKLEPKNKWDDPLETGANIHVPEIATNRAFVYYIVDNVLKSPHIKNTYFIQNLIKSLDQEFLINGPDSSQLTQVFNRGNAVKQLEAYLNNKIYCEQLRNGGVNLSEFTFLHE